MSRIINVVLAVMLFNITSTAQPVSNTRFSSSTSAISKGILALSNGGSVIYGTQEDATNPSDLDLQLAFTNASGQTTIKAYGDTEAETPTSAVELNGSIYVAGISRAAGGDLPMVIRYGLNGDRQSNFYYVQSVFNSGGYTSSIGVNHITTTTNGRLIVSGYGFKGSRRVGWLMAIDPALNQAPLKFVDNLQIGDRRMTEVHKVIREPSGNYVVFGSVIDGDVCNSELASNDLLLARVDGFLDLIGGSTNAETIGNNNASEIFLDAVRLANGSFAVLGRSDCGSGEGFGPSGVANPGSKYWVWYSNGSTLNQRSIIATSLYIPFVIIDYSYFDIPIKLVESCFSTNEVIILSKREPGSTTNNFWYSLERLDLITGDKVFLTGPFVTGVEGNARPTGIAAQVGTNRLLISQSYLDITRQGRSVFSNGSCEGGGSEECLELIDLSCGEIYRGNNAGGGNDYGRNVHNTCATVNTNSTFAGEDQTFRIQKTTSGTDLVIDLFAGRDLDVFLYRDLEPCERVISNCLGASVANLSNGHDVIRYANAPAGTYYVVVDASVAGVTADFELSANCGELACENALRLQCGQTVSASNIFGESFPHTATRQVSNFCNSGPGQEGAGDTGAEHVYYFDVSSRREVSISLVPKRNDLDLDIFLLSECETTSCIARSTNEAGLAELITGTYNPGRYYLVVEGWQGSEGPYDISLDCCSDEPNFTEAEYGADCDLDYLFIGNTGQDLSYRFFAQGGVVAGASWFVNNEEITVSAGATRLDYTFSTAAEYTVCYPKPRFEPNLQGKDGPNAKVSAFDCQYDYCCETFCIDYRPDNLDGLIYCDDFENCCGDICEGYSPAFAREDFSQYPLGTTDLPEMNELWFASDDGYHEVINDASGQALQIFGEEEASPFSYLDYRLQTGRKVPLGEGRYRVSVNITAVEEATFSTQDFGRETALTTINITPAGTLEFLVDDILTGTYAVAEGEDLRINQVIDLQSQSFSATLFVNDEYVGYRESFVSDPGLGGVSFSQAAGQNYIVQSICVRTRPLTLFCPTVIFDFSTCVANGEVYGDDCIARGFGLFTLAEIETCFSVCDYGGSLISRDVPVNDFIYYPAPSQLVSEECVREAYDDEVPPNLFATVYTFTNDDRTIASVDGLPNGFHAFFFSCGVQEDEIYGQECFGYDEVAGLTPFETYYIAIAGPRDEEIDFQIRPNDDACQVGEEEVIRCSGTIPEEITVSGNWAGQPNRFDNLEEGYFSCYNRFREYNLGEYIYRFELASPAIVNFDLTVGGGKAGLFVAANDCGGNCIAYTDNRIFENRTSLDSLRMGAGSYFLILDQDEEADNFSLRINCFPDSLNADLGEPLTVTIYDVGECEVKTENPHTFNLTRRSLNRLADQAKLSAEFISEGAFGRRVGAPSMGGEALFERAGSNQIPFVLPEQGSRAGDLRCGYNPGDSISIVARDGKRLVRINPTQYDISEPGRDLFQPGLTTVVTEARISTVASFDVSYDQLVFSNTGELLNGQIGNAAAFDVRSTLPFTVEVEPGSEWINLSDGNGIRSNLVYYGGGAQLVKISADNYFDPTPRRGRIIVKTQISENNPTPIVQIIDVAQYDPCEPAEVRVVAEPATVCRGESTTLRVETANGLPLELYDIYIDGKLTTNLTVSPDRNTTYRVTISDKGCTTDNTKAVEVKIGDPPQFRAEPLDVTNCTVDLSSYTATFSTDAMVTGISAGNLLAGANGNYSVSGVPKGNDLVVELTENGCAISRTVPAPDCSCSVIPPAPVAAITEVNYCAGSTKPLLTVDGTRYDVRWYDANDNPVANQPSFRVPGPGEYSVEYVDRASGVCRSNSRERFTVREFAPIELASIPTQTVCQGSSLDLLPSVSNGSLDSYRYTWRYRGNITKTTTYRFVADRVGRQEIELTATYPDDGCPVSRTIFVEVLAEPEVSFDYAFQACSPGSTVYSRRVMVKNGSISTGGVGNIVREGATDFYLIENIPLSVALRVTATNSSGNTNCQLATELLPAPDCKCENEISTFSFPTTELSICPGGTPSFISFPSLPTGFDLSFYREGGSTPLTYTGDSILLPGAGLYEARIISGSGNCTAQRNFSIAVTELSAPVAEIEPVNAICLGEPITLSGRNSVGQNVRFNWAGPGISAPASSAAELELVPASTGTQEYTLTITDENGCGATTTANLLVLERPVATLAITSDISCVGETDGRIAVTATGGEPAYFYEWSTGQRVGELNNLGAGNYGVTVSDNQGCEAAVGITLGQPDSLRLDSVEIIGTSAGSLNGSVTVNPSGGTPLYTYAWYLNGSPLGITNATVEDRGQGERLTVDVTDQNGCLLRSPEYRIPLSNSLVNAALSATVRVYPNPTSGDLNVELKIDHAHVASLTVLAPDGRRVLPEIRSTYQSGPVRIPVGNLPAGAYFVRVVLPDGVVTKPFIRL